MKRTIFLLLTVCIIITVLSACSKSSKFSLSDYTLNDFNKMTIKSLYSDINKNIANLKKDYIIPEFVKGEFTSQNVTFTSFRSAISDPLTITILSNSEGESILISLNKTIVDKNDISGKMDEFVLIFCSTVSSIDTKANLDELIAKIEANYNKQMYISSIVYNNYKYYYVNSDVMCSILITLAVKPVQI